MEIDLESTSPRLSNAKSLKLAVPGTFESFYLSGSNIVDFQKHFPTIFTFCLNLKIISSKQRPRKIGLVGSDGHQYDFLLKGHEDLRQDQRAMQIFGLVNTLLFNDKETSTRHLEIRTLSVIPLSHSTGLISWVSFCDTLHSLIKKYRDFNGLMLSKEHKAMIQFSPDCERLSYMQKIEAYLSAIENSKGDDLKNIMWLQSLETEKWYERRLRYVRSLGVMSIVGYILGLGDRHPSNLMVEKQSGIVIHIDFGDCFEVSMYRDKFPERIPFRLTRMLVNAMETSGIEGTFRISCEQTMRVLRFNKDSLMAILEAFVYDPLINWRLITSCSATLKSIHESELKLKDSEIAQLEDESLTRPDMAGALNVINRISNKLTGKLDLLVDYDLFRV